MKKASLILKAILSSTFLLATSLLWQAHAFTLTGAGAVREGTMIRYNFIISDWSIYDSTKGVCEKSESAQQCHIYTSAWKYPVSGTGVYPTSGTRSWTIPTRERSTLGNMLSDLLIAGFHVPLKTSILIPASVDASEACVGLSSARTSPTTGGAIWPFGPCLRLKNIAPPEMTCEAPDVKVEMGEYSSREFLAYGDTTPPKSFDIKLNKCSTGLSKINYSLAATPTAPAVNPLLGIVELNRSSTAKGVSLQVLDSNLQPIQLNKEYTFNTSTIEGGNFSIPMNARYIRTLPTGGSSPHVTGGTADAEITFIMNYL